MKYSNGTHHFLDTNVLLKHANADSGDCAGDLQKILDEAASTSPTRKLWISGALLGELRPSIFKPSSNFQDVDALAKYVRSIADIITPNPNVWARIARLRDIKWERPPNTRQAGEKYRRMSFADAMHIASALFVKEALGISDLEFLTFDEGKGDNAEDMASKPLSLLSLEEFTHGISGSGDVVAAVGLHRCRPQLQQRNLA